MMNAVEFFLLDLFGSWTFAKFLPYVVLLLLGGLAAWYLKKMRSRLWIKLSFMLLVAALPFATYFFFYPIYQPDLFDQTYKPGAFVKVQTAKAMLAVVVLPGCPYCEGSIKTMNQLQAQNPKLKIMYYLVSDDSTAKASYKKQLDKRIGVVYEKNAMRWMLAAEGVFPSYLLYDHKQLKAAWHNTTFGVRALDYLRAYK
ncbi:MAG: hypothetical protein ACKO5N_02270 [Sphingomonadales bacterium]